MVIGNGLVAKSFKDYQEDKRYIVFASGVSNSTSIDANSFEREKNMLLETIFKYPDSKLIYFSTCSIYDRSLRNSAYVKHKLEMEELVKNQRSDYNIFRVSNLAGFSNNPHTVLNYFFRHIHEDIFFYVWKNASRNVIDVDHAYLICNDIIKNRLFDNRIVNIANPWNYSVLEIVRSIEVFLGKQGNYEIIERNSNPVIDIAEIKPLLIKLQLTFDAGYLNRIISKYYSSYKI